MELVGVGGGGVEFGLVWRLALASCPVVPSRTRASSGRRQQNETKRVVSSGEMVQRIRPTAQGDAEATESPLRARNEGKAQRVGQGQRAS